MQDFPDGPQPQHTPITPLQRSDYTNSSQRSAVTMIRQKLDALYRNEPSAKEEVKEITDIPTKQRTKHQQFIFSLTNSGKSLADIQTEWHNYYVSLPDDEKHEVWHEFYETHQRSSDYLRAYQKAQKVVDEVKSGDYIAQSHTPKLDKPVFGIMPTSEPKTRTVAQIKNSITSKVDTRTRIKAKQQLKSIAFGLSMGGIVVFIMMFSFFNERFIAPFITPSKASAFPVIIDASGDNKVGPDPLVYVPSINAAVPVNYDLTDNIEANIQANLENGVVKMAGTANPGQKGNVVIVGHSSNNILNKGKYKFAFVNLRKVNVGELFYLHNGGQRYTYKIIEKRIVDPTDVAVTNQDLTKSYATLVTCDPPGTSLKRLILVGEQIRPDPAVNADNTQKNVEKPAELPGNSPSLWSRIF